MYGWSTHRYTKCTIIVMHVLWWYKLKDSSVTASIIGMLSKSKGQTPRVAMALHVLFNWETPRNIPEEIRILQWKQPSILLMSVYSMLHIWLVHTLLEPLFIQRLKGKDGICLPWFAAVAKRFKFYYIRSPCCSTASTKQARALPKILYLQLDNTSHHVKTRTSIFFTSCSSGWARIVQSGIHCLEYNHAEYS